MTEGERIQKIEDQIDRLVADAESEKDTRKRRNEGIDAKLMDHTLKIDRHDNAISNVVKVVWIVVSIIISLVIHTINDMITKGN